MKMKKYNILTFTLIFIGCSLFVMTCEKWEAPNYPEGKTGTIPVITRIEPADSAAGGVNFITVYGDNFAQSLDSNCIYFDNLLAENISGTDSSVTVRRPNLVSDSAVVKVYIETALVVAKYSPYKITSTYSVFGNFLQQLLLRSLAVDSDDNLYVSQRAPHTIFKITPEGDKTEICTTTKVLNDARISPSGQLVCMFNDTIITIIDEISGTESIWAYVDSAHADGSKRGEKVQYGDFDQNGYFYTAGNKSGMYVKAPGDSIARPNDTYWNDKIYCIRVYNGYLYLLVDAGIVRHQIIDNAGNINPTAETVLLWTDTGEFSSSTPSYFTFSSNGKIVIGTDNIDPILIYNPADQSFDTLYKGILPTPAMKVVWGNGNILYMIQGGAEVVLKIDMGETGAPYYGRQ